MNEGGKEGARILGFPSERVVRTPQEVAEEKLKTLEVFARKTIDAFDHQLTMPERNLKEQVKLRIARLNFDSIAASAIAVREKGPTRRTFPSDLAYLETFLAERNRMRENAEPKVRTPDEVTELELKKLDKIAREMLDKFLRNLDEEDRAYVGRVKLKMEGVSLKRLAAETWKVRKRHESGYPTTPMDIAYVAVYLERRGKPGMTPEHP